MPIGDVEPVSEEDEARHVAWLRSEAEKGHPAAQHGLGILYNMGWMGVSQDKVQAIVWFHHAADRDHGSAQFQLTLSKALDPAEYYQAESIWHQLKIVSLQSEAAKGRAEAQYRLGIWYYMGKGVPQDKAQAMVWFHRAADQGHELAQNQLVFLKSLDPAEQHQAKSIKKKPGNVNHPKGVSTTPISSAKSEAIEWLESAARSGDANAQFRLGMLYASGDMGVSQDRLKAMSWFRLAAAQGNDSAQLQLFLSKSLYPVEYRQFESMYRSLLDNVDRPRRVSTTLVTSAQSGASVTSTPSDAVNSQSNPKSRISSSSSVATARQHSQNRAAFLSAPRRMSGVQSEASATVEEVDTESSSMPASMTKIVSRL